MISDQNRIAEKYRAQGQGKKQEIDGYYYPDTNLVYKVMRPSNTLNDIVNSL